MAQMPTVCVTCKDPINAQFAPPAGTRDTATLTYPIFVTEQCFVRDTIEFLDGGQIVFSPNKDGRYFDNYNVICRKLFITGGSAPLDKLTPCSPDDPGKNYKGNNVITWAGRLQTAGNGPDFGSPAKDGVPPPPNDKPFDANSWKDLGQGNNGMNGFRGEDGSKGNPGGSGTHALNITDTRERRPVLNVVALEVEFGSPLSHLIIDWNGQTAGNGGRGQNGGRGGDGMGGRDGSTDESIWGDSCERQPGNGGDSGDGGNGGPGGNGGNGGNAGDIFIISTVANLSTGGAFKSGQISYEHGGGDGGNSGDGGRGGRAGAKVGRKGKKTSECDEADHDGQVGNPGIPEPLAIGGTVSGSPGAKGNPGKLAFEVIAPPGSATCADLIPHPLKISSIVPNSGAKGSTVTVTITGVGFDAVTPTNNKVDVSGFGVSVGSLTAVTATSITCGFAIANLAPSTARDVTVKVGVSASTTLVGGFTVV